MNGKEHVPLGVTDLIGASLELFFRKFFVFFLIAAVPTTALTLVSTLLQSDVINSPLVAGPLGGVSVEYVVSVLLSGVAALIVSGVITLAAYDLQQGKPLAIGRYLGRTVEVLLPLIGLGVVLMIVSMMGYLLLILPGLYLSARFWVMAPVVLLEDCGWGALTRASQLSKDYRWPIVGAILLIFLLLFVVSLVVGLMVGLFGGIAAAIAGVNLIFVVLLQSASSAVTYGLLAVFTAVLYARLREIKEGMSVADITRVFS